MIDDCFIIDAVAHCYNHSPENRRRKPSEGSAFTAPSGAYALHKMVNPPSAVLSPKRFARDWQPEEFIDMILLESPTDLICMHSVALFHSYLDGLVTNEKGAYLKKKYPDRVLWYGTADLGEGKPKVLAMLDEVIDQGADGIKFYPTGTNHQTLEQMNWLMSDRQIAYPLFEHIIQRGIRNIAIHKLAEYEMLPPGPEKRAYGVNDLAAAARDFPDVTFHLVHAGWLLMEDTLLLMQEHQNITAVLEGPALWPIIDPKRFELFLSLVGNSIGYDRLLYSSGTTVGHPRPIIEAFLAYEPPPGADFRFTAEDKKKVLGLNLARYHGIDIAERRRKIAGDRFSQAVARDGYRPLWSGLA
jgi:predicted TIM-barrel fold metal-dependent hydrolase